MDSYIAAVFDGDAQAADALARIWEMHGLSQLRVHGAAVLRRDREGRIEVARDETDPGRRAALGTAAGVALGGLIGVSLPALGAGAVAGGLAGFGTELAKSREREQAANEASLSIADGQAALVAEVTEESPAALDAVMRSIGGTVYRRPSADIRDDAARSAYFSDLLLPYAYRPHFAKEP